VSQLQLAVLLSLVYVAALGFAGYRPYVDECRGRLRQTLAVFLLIGILALVAFYPVTAFGHGEEIDPALLSFPSLLLGELLLVGFLLLWWRLGSAPIGRFLHLSRGAWWAKVRRGLLTGAAGWALTAVVTGAAAGIVSALGLGGASAGAPPVMVWLARLPWGEKLIIVAAAMTVEEAFFRGFLQARFGLLLSSLLFALSHFSYGLPFMIVGVFTISLVIGWTFERSGDLLPCIVAHGVFDGVQLLVILPWAVHMWSAGLA
jgi:membrane protease YdiL (CAAX protease family)